MQTGRNAASYATHMLVKVRGTEQVFASVW